jgi:hypothetical protein
MAGADQRPAPAAQKCWPKSAADCILASASDTSGRKCGVCAVFVLRQADHEALSAHDKSAVSADKGKRHVAPASLVCMPKEQLDSGRERPKNDENEPQLSADEAREILRGLRPLKPEDRLPEGTTIITFIRRLPDHKRR